MRWLKMWRHVSMYWKSTRALKYFTSCPSQLRSLKKTKQSWNHQSHQQEYISSDVTTSDSTEASTYQTPLCSGEGVRSCGAHRCNRRMISRISALYKNKGNGKRGEKNQTTKRTVAWESKSSHWFSHGDTRPLQTMQSARWAARRNLCYSMPRSSQAVLQYSSKILACTHAYATVS